MGVQMVGGGEPVGRCDKPCGGSKRKVVGMKDGPGVMKGSSI